MLHVRSHQILPLQQNSPLTENGILVRGSNDVETLVRGVQDKPTPTGTLNTKRSRSELLLEGVKRAEITASDCYFEFPRIERNECTA